MTVELDLWGFKKIVEISDENPPEIIELQMPYEIENIEELLKEIDEHMKRLRDGDFKQAIDIANFLMFMWHNTWERELAT